jgi:hypothetical protein
MNDSTRLGLSLAASLAIVGGFAVFVFVQGGRVVQPPQSPPAASRVATPGTAERPAASQPAPATTVTAAPPPMPHSGVYRCAQGGRVTYSDTPCAGGVVVDTRSAVSGFRPAEPLAALRARAKNAAATGEGEDSAAASNSGAVDRVARCAQVREQIDHIDASARAGGSAQRQDWLRDQRRKLEDERYRLKC